MRRSSGGVWVPREPAAAQLREWDELERVQQRDSGLDFYGYGCGALVDECGSVLEELPWQPNAYGNEGKADVLNVYYRETAQTADAKYLGLATYGSLADTTVMTSVTEPSGGYARIQLLHGTWSSPSDPGDGNRQIAYSQVTFGPATGTWTVTYAFITTTASGTGGLFIFYIPLAVTVSSGLSLLYTIRQKTRSV